MVGRDILPAQMGIQNGDETGVDCGGHVLHVVAVVVK